MKISGSLPVLLAFIFVSACTSPADRTYEEKDSTGQVITDSNNVASDPVSGNDGPVTQDTTKSTTDTSEKVDDVKETPRNPGREVIRGQVSGSAPEFVHSFNASSPGKLNALIASDKIGCNIRIARIVAPGGSSEGPFGKETKYNLTSTGRYQIVIGHGTAGNTETCDFTLRLVFE